MNQRKLAEGMPVRITQGTYAGAEGVIEDLDPECSAVRIRTKAADTAYAYTDAVAVLTKPSDLKNRTAK
jgi:transcription elongation factor